MKLTKEERAVREELIERSHGACEARIQGVCTGRHEHPHHRKLRRWKDNRLINHLGVCFSCHRYIHAHVAWSYIQGFLVHSFDDPSVIPVNAGVSLVLALEPLSR